MDGRDGALAQQEPPQPALAGGLNDLEQIQQILDRRGIRYSLSSDTGYTLAFWPTSEEGPEPFLVFSLAGTLRYAGAYGAGWGAFG